jgi:hypothetical protein
MDGGVGTAIPAAVHPRSLDEEVRDESPDELRELNEKKLRAIGVPAAKTWLEEKSVSVEHLEYAEFLVCPFNWRFVGSRWLGFVSELIENATVCRLQ